MTPNARAATLHVLLNLLVANRTEFTYLVAIQDLKALKGVILTVSCNDSVLTEHTPWHFPSDAFVILQLAIIAAEYFRRNVARRAPPLSREEGLDHHWLVNMRHAHIVQKKFLQRTKAHCVSHSAKWRWQCSSGRRSTTITLRGSRTRASRRLPGFPWPQPYRAAAARGIVRGGKPRGAKRDAGDVAAREGDIGRGAAAGRIQHRHQ